MHHESAPFFRILLKIHLNTPFRPIRGVIETGSVTIKMEQFNSFVQPVDYRNIDITTFQGGEQAQVELKCTTYFPFRPTRVSKVHHPSFSLRPTR